MGGFQGPGRRGLSASDKAPSVPFELLKPLANLTVDPKHPEREGSGPLLLAATYGGVKIVQ